MEGFLNMAGQLVFLFFFLAFFSDENANPAHSFHNGENPCVTFEQSVGQVWCPPDPSLV